MFNHVAKRENKILRLQTQAKLSSYRTSQKKKFGHKIPSNNDCDHALSIDKKNGNNEWSNFVKLEIDQQHQYET